MPHVRTSIRELIAVIAASCMAMGGFRLHPALGAYVLGVFGIAWVRVCQIGELDAFRAGPRKASAEIISVITAVSTAGVILFVSAIPALFLEVILSTPHVSHYSRTSVEPSDFVIIPMSALIGIPVCWLLRKAFKWRTAGEGQAASPSRSGPKSVRGSTRFSD